MLFKYCPPGISDFVGNTDIDQGYSPNSAGSFQYSYIQLEGNGEKYLNCYKTDSQKYGEAVSWAQGCTTLYLISENI